MRNKWPVVILFVFVVLFTVVNTDSSWAANLKESYTNFNNSSVYKSSVNFDNAQLNDSNSTSSSKSNENNQLKNISGNVIRCDSGTPFSQVNVELSDLAGNEILKTKTDRNGNYNLIFKANGSSFKVSASYPGHVTSSKIVNLSDDFNGSLYGTANFQLGPEPVVIVDAPSSQFLNETFNFQVNFDNAGNETGFGPIVQLILPPQIQFNNATFLGAPVGVTYVGMFPGTGIGTLTDPLSGLNVTGTSGYSLYILEYPLGSYTKGQPIATIDINALLLGNSTLGVPLNITAYPVFRFGANETGTNPIRGNATTAGIIPTVININKTSNAPENETATGHNFIRTYSLVVDVARGRTVNNVVVRDDIPHNLQFIEVTYLPAGAVITHLPTISEYWLTIDLGNLTGKTDTPLVINYTVFANETDIYGNPVLNPTTGTPTNATNSASVNGTYQFTPVSAADSYNLDLKSLAIQKHVTVTGSDPKPKPTNILEYDLNFQVSDYFSLNNFVIQDTLGDGQTFLTAGYAPYINLHLPIGSTGTLYFNLSNPNQFQIFYNDSTGITYLTFNITQLLIDNNYTGILEGGNYTGTDYGATQGTLTFWSQIDVNYEETDRPIVSSDSIGNSVQVEANLVNSGNSVEDTSGTEVIIVAPTSQKSVYKINGEDPTGTPYRLKPGDTITFSLWVDVPTTNLHNFNIVDYLPIPFLRATQFTTGQGPDTTQPIPATGQWRLGENDTLSSLTGIIPLLNVDALQNTLTFSYGDIYNATQPNGIIHILFTVTATGDPMADGLWLTNFMNSNYENSPGNTFSDNKIVSIITGEPQLTIEKIATPTTDLQAGNVVIYTITIKNTGNAPAYNVVVKDDLLTANHGYIASVSPAARYANGTEITGLNLLDLFTANGLNFTALYPIYGINSANNTIIITYNATLNSTVYPLQVINNTAQITKFTSLPPADSPNFVTDPTKYQDDATVRVAGPQFAKTYVGSQGGPSTGSNLTIGEIGRFRLAITLPAGQINDLVIVDTLPAGLTYAGYYNIIFNPDIDLPSLIFTITGNNLRFAFNGLTNTSNVANRTFCIDFDVMMANNNTANPPHTGSRTRTNSATLDWDNRGHVPITRTASVGLVEPHLTVTKTFTPNIVQGGQTTTVRLRVTNNGSNALSTAYNVIVTDSLSWASQIFDLNSVVAYNTPPGFTFNYDITNKIVTFTGGNLTVGQIVDFYFNITALPIPFIGSNDTNVANVNYWSLPWVTNPDPNSRNYTNSGSAPIRVGDPVITKAVLNSSIHGSSGNLAIGEHVTYRITVTVPKGQVTNLRITDILPDGYGYIGYTLSSSTWNGTLGNLIVTPNGRNILFNFTGTTTGLSDNNTFYIDLEAVVLNQSVNQIGNTKVNNVNLTWDENSQGPFTSSVNTTIVSPALNIQKTVTPNSVDGSDHMNISLRVQNTGNSPAYDVKIIDMLNSTLFDPASFTFTPVAGYTISIIGNIISIVGNPGTFMGNGTTLYFNFTVNAKDDVPSNSTFTNQADGIYYSMPSTFTERRESSVSSNVVNIGTVNPAIAKTVESTSESDSTGNNVLIGEVVIYRIDLTIPEGRTLNVSLSDILPANLQFNSGTGRIMRSSGGITATGFGFTSPAGQYQILPDSYFTGNWLNLLLGNITFNGTNGLHNGTISIIFNVTVLNIPGNQNGTQIPNSVILNFTNATGASRTLIEAAPDLTVATPQISTTKTVNKSVIQGGETVTYTVVVRNNAGATAPAYDIVITDYLPEGLIYGGVVTLPSGWTVTVDPWDTRKLIFTSPVGFKIIPGQDVTIEFNATAVQNLTYNSTLDNTVNATGTSLSRPHGTNDATPGDPGTSTGERTGENGPGGLNNIIATANTTIVSRAPSISKGANRTTSPIGETTTYTLTVPLPAGYTPNLIIVDILPGGMAYISGTLYVTLPGGVTSRYQTTEISPFFIINGQTITFNFGWINATQEGSITLHYDVMVKNIISNVNGTNLTNSATLSFTDGQGNESTSGPVSSTVKVVEPQLQIAKTSDKTNYNPGEDVIFTLNVEHTAGSASNAYNLRIVDTIPAGLTYKIGSSVLPAGWLVEESQSALNMIIFYTNSTTALLLGQTATIKFNCTVGNYTWAGENLTNNASLNYTSTFNQTNARNYGPVNANATVHITGADIYVIKTGTETINAGESFNYYLRIGNSGPDTAMNVTLNDLIDPVWFARMSNVQYYLNGTGYSFTNNGTIVIGELVPGSEISINITGILNSSAPAGTINNTATVNSTTPDPYPGNNTDTALTEVRQKANLTVEKTVNESVVTAGTPIHYTVTITNNGPSDAYQVHVTDTLPSYVTGLYYSVNGGSSWISWPVLGFINLGTLSADATIQILINGTVNPAAPGGTVLNNTVNVTSPNNPGSHEDWVTSTVNTVANLTLNKNNNPSSTVIAGNDLIYQMVLVNNGPSVARNVIFCDNELNSWLTNRYYRYSINGGSWSSWIGFIGDLVLNATDLFPSGFLGVGENFTVEINGTVNASAPGGTVLTNYANVTSDTSPSGIISSTVTNNVETLVNLSITKSGQSTAIAGTPISYMITVKNNGPSDAHEVRVSDILPFYVTGLYYSLDNWVTWSNWPPVGGYIDLGNLIANAVQQIWINGTVDPTTPNGTVLNNTARVTSPTDPESHQTWFTTNVDTQSNMILTKTESPDPVVAGETLVYTMVLTNNGPSVARDLMFHDNLPDELINAQYKYRLNNNAWSSWSAFHGSFIINLITGYLVVGDNVTVEINTTVNSTTPNGTVLNNTANVTSSTDPFEVISPPVEATVITKADLTLTKVGEVDPVLAGRELLYTMVLTNNGPSAAWNVIFHDDTISNWLINRYYRYNINDGSWSDWISFAGNLMLNVTDSIYFPAGFLGVGENFAVQINATVNSSTPNGTVLINYANVTSATDPYGVVSPPVDTTVNTLAELVITKVADVEKIVRGHPIHYTITITNVGPSDALHVDFYDDYDPKILLNTYYSTSTGIPWTAFTAPLNLTNLISALTPGSSIIIWINGTGAQDASQNLTNTAVTSSETDPAGNKTAQVKTPIQTSNVTIKKIVSDSRPYLHETIYFTLIVQNWGPDTAVDVYVLDKLPAGVKYISSTANYGYYDPDTGMWTIGNLPKDAIAQLIITVVVEKVGPLENHAHVYTASYDPILDDNNTTATLEVLPRPESVQGKTIGMQKTGIPLPLLALAVLMLLGGLVVKRK